MSVKEMSLYFLGGVPIQSFGFDPIDPGLVWCYLPRFVSLKFSYKTVFYDLWDKIDNYKFKRLILNHT